MWMWLLYTDRPGYASRLLLANYRPREERGRCRLERRQRRRTTEEGAFAKEGIPDCGRGRLDGGLLSGRGMGASTGARFRPKSGNRGLAMENVRPLGLILGRTVTCLSRAQTRTASLRAMFVLQSLTQCSRVYFLHDVFHLQNSP